MGVREEKDRYQNELKKLQFTLEDSALVITPITPNESLILNFNVLI